MPSIYNEPFAFTPFTLRAFANPFDAAVEAFQPMWRFYADAAEASLALWGPLARGPQSIFFRAPAQTAEIESDRLIASDEPAMPAPIEPEIAPPSVPVEAPAIDPAPAEAPGVSIPEPAQASADAAVDGARKAKRARKRAAAAASAD